MCPPSRTSPLIATCAPPSSESQQPPGDADPQLRPGTPSLPDTSVRRHLVDVHCHPTDARDGVPARAMADLDITVCAMSTHSGDQAKVRELARMHPDKVVPCFGYHPWFSHFISITDEPAPDKETHYRRLFLPHTLPASPPPVNINANTNTNTNTDTPSHEAQFAALLPHLPAPRPLAALLADLRTNLTDPTLPAGAMLGEVGLDRVFRVPHTYVVAPGAARVITPFTVPLAHQRAVLKAQLLLAVAVGANASVHSVKAQQATVALLDEVREEVGEDRWLRVSVDMHSCGLSPESWRDLEKKHSNVFLSLSTVINHNHSTMRQLIAICAPDRILAESDYNDITRCTGQTWDMVKIIAEVKGWRVESTWDYPEDETANTAAPAQESWGVVKRLEQNWFRFRDGNHPLPQKKKNRKERTLRDYAVD